MKNNILIKPITEIDYYRALILSSGIHRLFLPMKFQFIRDDSKVKVMEYFVNIDGYANLISKGFFTRGMGYSGYDDTAN